MNNKLLISVSLPILDISFDLEVPNIIKVGSLKNIMLDYVRNNYNNDMNLGTFRLIKRESGIELFRVVLMIMIIGLHYLNGYMGGALEYTNEGTFNWYLIRFLESMFIIAVDCFISITIPPHLHQYLILLILNVL